MTLVARKEIPDTLPPNAEGPNYRPYILLALLLVGGGYLGYKNMGGIAAALNPITEQIATVPADLVVSNTVSPHVPPTPMPPSQGTIIEALPPLPQGVSPDDLRFLFDTLSFPLEAPPDDNRIVTINGELDELVSEVISPRIDQQIPENEHGLAIYREFAALYQYMAEMHNSEAQSLEAEVFESPEIRDAVFNNVTSSLVEIDISLESGDVDLANTQYNQMTDALSSIGTTHPEAVDAIITIHSQVIRRLQLAYMLRASEYGLNSRFEATTIENLISDLNDLAEILDAPNGSMLHIDIFELVTDLYQNHPIAKSGERALPLTIQPTRNITSFNHRVLSAADMAAYNRLFDSNNLRMQTLWLKVFDDHATFDSETGITDAENAALALAWETWVSAEEGNDAAEIAVARTNFYAAFQDTLAHLSPGQFNIWFDEQEERRRAWEVIDLFTRSHSDQPLDWNLAGEKNNHLSELEALVLTIPDVRGNEFWDLLNMIYRNWWGESPSSGLSQPAASNERLPDEQLSDQLKILKYFDPHSGEIDITMLNSLDPRELFPLMHIAYQQLLFLPDLSFITELTSRLQIWEQARVQAYANALQRNRSMGRGNADATTKAQVKVYRQLVTEAGSQV